MTEEVTRVASHVGDDGQVQYDTVHTGRPRRPESVAEWAAQRVAALGHTVRVLPAGQALITLLEAGEDFNVKAAGKPLDAWQRHAVLLELARLLAAAHQGYPAAAAPMRQVHQAWIRAWGDREPAPRRAPVIPVVARPRVASLADTGADAAVLRASWDSFGAAVLARRAAVAAAGS